MFPARGKPFSGRLSGNAARNDWQFRILTGNFVAGMKGFPRAGNSKDEEKNGSTSYFVTGAALSLVWVRTRWDEAQSIWDSQMSWRERVTKIGSRSGAKNVDFALDKPLLLARTVTSTSRPT
jgi:hypothetical protein